MPIAPNKAIGYFTQNMEQTTTKDSIAYYRLAEYNNSEPQDTIRDYYPTGELYRKANMVLQNGEEVEDGLVTWYHKNGQKSKEIAFTQGEEGELNKWDEQGEPVLDFEYYFVKAKLSKAKDKLDFSIKALKEAELEYGENHKNYAIALNSLALVYSNLSIYEKALPLYLEALKKIQNSNGKASSYYNEILNNLALLYFETGAYQKALPIYSEICENAKDSKNYIGYLNNLASLHKRMGAYQKALPLYLEAITKVEGLLGEEHFYYGVLSNNLSELYHIIGEYEKSELLVLKAIENIENSLGKTHVYYGFFLTNLATIYNKMGKYEKSLSIFLKALESIESSVGKKHPNYGMCLSNMGLVYGSMGMYENAVSSQVEALEILEETLSKNHIKYANTQNNLATLYTKIGEIEKALPLHIETLETFKNSLGESHAYYGLSLRYMASLYKLQKNYDKGISSLLQSNQIKRKNLLQTLSFTSQKGQQSYLKTQSEFLDLTASYQHQSPKNYDELNEILYDNELLWKGLLLSNQQQFSQQIKASKDTVLDKQYTQWQSINELIGYQSTLALNRRIYNVDSLQTLSDKMEENLALKSAEFSNLRKTQAATWQDIQQKLKPNEIAIEFINFENKNINEEEDEQLYAAVILRASGYPQYIPLCSQADLLKQLNQQETKLNKQITSVYASRSMKDGEKEVKTLFSGKSKSLYQLLWQPLDSMLKEVNTIYYAPSGLLHKINLAAITNENDQVLAEKYNFHLLGSTRQLLNYKSNKADKENLLLYGNIAFGENQQTDKIIAQKDTNNLVIDYNPYADAVRSMSLNLKQLPGTQQEIEAIAQLAKRKHKYTLKEENEATESTFKTLVETQKPSVLHIATHGFFYQQMVQDTLTSYPYFMTLENALMRSGLALSGANEAMNKTSNENVDDGILTAYEISKMDLKSVDLAVLSACETANGDIEGTEGVYGLQRAFKLAGANKLMMSLWKVDDQATQEFMTQFYTNWLKKKKTIYEAFTTAQTYMRKKYKNPYYWAAFVLME